MKGKKMKKIIVVAAVLALAGTQLHIARAGERGWATAGKILTGVAIGAVVVSAVNAHADYSAGYYSYSSPGVSYTYSYNACPPPAPVVCAPRVVYVPPVVCMPAPVVCAPRPVVVYRAPVVCVPPVVTVRYGHSDRHGHGHHGRW